MITYLIVVLLVAALAVFLLSAFAPSKPTHPFWLWILRVRKLMDAVCYWFMTLCLVGTVVVAVFTQLRDYLTDKQDGKALLSGLVLIALLALLLGFGIRGLVREKKRGVRCECCGDCSKCRIQCRSNEKYYGIQRRTAQTPPSENRHGKAVTDELAFPVGEGGSAQR